MADDDEIPILEPFMPAEVGDRVVEVLQSGWIGGGPRVERFEERIGDRIDNPHVVAVNSGSSALSLAYDLAGIEPGDEVVTTPFTCAATNVPLLHFEPDLVFAETDPATGLPDPASVAELVSDETTALVVVDMHGTPAAYDELLEVVDEHDVTLIQDAAQSFGGAYDGVPVGAIADYTTFSFGPVKTITSVMGGAVAVPDAATAERAKRRRWHGIETDKADKLDRKRPWTYEITEPGYRYTLNDVFAAVGNVQLDYLDELVATQREQAARYDEAFADLEAVRTLSVPSGSRSARWLYPVLVEDRLSFIDFMADRGIQCSALHQSNIEASVFDTAVDERPRTRWFDQRVVCVPNGWFVDEEARERIVDAVRAYDDGQRTPVTEPPAGAF
ncbi:DegT/DnrJ/EryC1/StrS family aminotransferase [Haloglomus halophilum]|uniref:DegT/DnrJ/EryC1/StrS family aminotransferase n=1 Tax=Haloglomus halophilum TaxID=2962672 RepID=UPI0020C9E500|nr:DegT/DnrJ/EryC1/StrS family aminotransferase [Haloglomus halophilum]